MRSTIQSIVLVVIFLPLGRLFSQTLLKPVGTHYKRCYTVERAKELRRLNPNAETDEQFEKWLKAKIKEKKALAARPLFANYTIPIVFHIVHNGEAEGTSLNIDAAFVQEQVLQLNKDFANQSNSPYAVAAAAGIQFVLAQDDPSANALTEAGIDRINRNDKGWNDYSSGWDVSYLDGTVKPGSVWDPARYFNVWVIPQLNGGSTDILGYSTLPASSTLAGLNNNETNSTAGVVVLTSTVGSAFAPGSCGTGYGLGKTLTHESGHYFGLRHIWGDADCGNDYCDDTPVHFNFNNGVPTHPKRNDCGTTDEMFENYMDYSDDIVLNTFTADQVDRMQTVMLNSPRRVSLAASNVGAVTIRGSNQVSFINCSGDLAVSEKGVNASYPRYKDVSLTLNVEDVATGDATVTFAASGTALSGKDYQLLTPSVSFAAGDNYKPVNIRVFDNPEIDADRTIVLSYTIAGNGVRAGANAQTVTIEILDDDNMRVGEKSIKLIDEHFEKPVGARGLPQGWGLLTTGGYVNSFVASTNGDAGGSGLAAHVTNNVTSKPNTYTKGTEGAAVLQSPVIDAGSVQSLGELSFTYKVHGLPDNDDAILTYTSSAAPTGPFYYYGNTPGLEGYGPYSSSTTTINRTPVISAPPTLENRKFNLSFYWETGTLTTGVNPGFNVDDIVLTATPFHVETAVSSSYTFDVGQGTAVNNFKSTNNNAVASLSNLSVPVPQLTAKVTEAGNGNIGFSTTAGSFLRSRKVFELSPATPNTTARYSATFYFTDAELSAWGADKLNLKIMKVREGVSLNSTLDISNTEIVTPTVVEDTAAGYISYSGTFTGFSQFMLVSPLAALPVSFVDFQATPVRNSIQLVWSTSQEHNNRGFAIERSTDGANFNQIGFVPGAGNTDTTTSYQYVDKGVQPGTTYYYRIRQEDLDNGQTYSDVRQARIKSGEGIAISVNPNPAKDFVNLFITGTNDQANITLINQAGQQVLHERNVNAGGGAYRLPLRAVAEGVYTLIVHLPEGTFTKKIVIR